MARGQTAGQIQPVIPSTSRTIVLKNPVRKGYTFKGWYSDPKFKKKVTKIASGSTGSRKLYARWVRK